MSNFCTHRISFLSGTIIDSMILEMFLDSLRFRCPFELIGLRFDCKLVQFSNWFGWCSSVLSILIFLYSSITNFELSSAWFNASRQLNWRLLSSVETDFAYPDDSIKLLSIGRSPQIWPIFCCSGGSCFLTLVLDFKVVLNLLTIWYLDLFGISSFIPDQLLTPCSLTQSIIISSSASLQ